MTRRDVRVVRSWGMGAVALVAALSGCVFDRITLPLAANVVVVHGVLNPGVTDQVVLLERALDGQGNTVRVPYDSLNPIVSNGGTPIRDARVVVRNSRGDSVVLREERSYRADGKGAGVYRFANIEGVGAPFALVPSFVVAPGERYELRVATTDGAVVTGATTVPLATGRTVPTVPRQFYRDRDSVFVGWQPVANAARFEVRIESVSGPFVAFVDSLEYLVAGSLTHTSRAGRPRVFWPGVRQLVTVSAVDANYHDYYRSGSDDFGTRGLITRLAGGVGVFGSMSRVRERTLDVTADNADAPAGRWEATTTVASPLPQTFQLWPESESLGATRLSGQVLGLSISAPPQTVVATQTGVQITVSVLARQSLRDTVVTIDGRLEGLGSGEVRLTGTVRGTGQAVVYRRR
ncbi:DUF4249 family protein [Gemmatimonas phototrophica]|nr:DUF4249 family protein [Gemmatimonas phototrophica]